jgi:hypothetical protein
MLDTHRCWSSAVVAGGSEVAGVLKELSVDEQRYQAILAVVEDGLSVTDVAAKAG